MNLVADSVCQPAWRVWDGPFTSMCVWWLIDSEVLLCHGDLLNNLFIITVASRYLSCSWLKVLYYNILRALVLLLLLLCSPRISMTCFWLHQRELQEWIFLTFFFFFTWWTLSRMGFFVLWIFRMKKLGWYIVFVIVAMFGLKQSICLT